MSVSAHLNVALERGVGTDVTIAAAASDGGLEERRFHSLLLTRVPYFEAALGSSFQEGLTKHIHIDDVPSRLLFPLLKALYTDQIENADAFGLADVVDMLGLCRRFQFPPLFSKMLVDIAQPLLSWGANVTEVLVKAMGNELSDLQKACLDKVEPAIEEAKKEFAYQVEVPSRNFLRARMAVTGAMMEKLQASDPAFQTLEELDTLSVVTIADDRNFYAPHSYRFVPRDKIDKVKDGFRKYHDLMMIVLQEERRTSEIMMGVKERASVHVAARNAEQARAAGEGGQVSSCDGK
eukprot:TRINITY_DN49112_c0_g1_i2.p1 TRINITY_DN49112_c0_g1~~TRINITY_DN49112_c0_g1_i2.p1  ORF type:complete len:293 (-),score=57.86 TRINITY_DN49112_c0_g1_i2:155-1033(-)